MPLMRLGGKWACGGNSAWPIARTSWPSLQGCAGIGNGTSIIDWIMLAVSGSCLFLQENQCEMMNK
jgi:hypothetical protein